MRDVFVRTLLEIARHDPRVMLLTADLGFGVLDTFRDELPGQYMNIGVAEQNLIGLATGLALGGRIVYAYSIANFPTLRCLEQIRNDACYHDANVKIVAVGGGFSYGALGVSHHATEDIAVMRALPGMTVVCPADHAEAASATSFVHTTPGTCYLRLDKSHVSTAHALEEAVVPGRARFLRRGGDVVILGVGGVLDEAMRAAAALSSEGTECAVLSVHAVKPIDRQTIARACASTPLVITIEEHVLDGGFGSAVVEVLADEGVFPPAVRRMGLRDTFSSTVGSQKYLRRRYGLDAAAIADVVRTMLGKSPSDARRTDWTVEAQQ